MLDTPILFLIFNRPQLTEKVFAKIREVKPKQLFVAADGPRESREGEDELCKLTRKIATDVDWDCDVKTLFRDKNKGCGKAVNEAISWFFSHVEEGIILEDDILVDNSFFTFCEKNLYRYRNDTRIMMISGFNHLGTWRADDSDYFFSHLGSIWGWATWKRAWNLNLNNIEDWDFVNENKIINQVMYSDMQIKHRENVIALTFNGLIDTWDYIWSFYRLINSGLSIMPSKNLVKNIGFGEEATHTIQDDIRFTGIPVYSESYSFIKDPKFIYANREFDLLVFEKFVEPKPNQQTISKNKIKVKAKSFIKRIIVRIF